VVLKQQAEMQRLKEEEPELSHRQRYVMALISNEWWLIIM